MTTLRVGAATDVGRRRQNNQDSLLTADPLYAVADGMGGYAGGEIASATAVEALRTAFSANPTAEGLERAVWAANEAVQSASQESPDLRNMGTTLVAVALVRDGDDELFAVASIGDSRVYLLRDGELTQLTSDHSVAEELLRSGQITEAEAAVHPNRHMLTRVLGPSGDDGPDMQKLVPYTGDRILLCSDGLYNEVGDREIAKVLRTVRDPDEAAHQLVDMANARGGGDNISVVVVDVVDDDGRAEVASAALASDPPTSAMPETAPDRRGLMTADERNAQLRDIGRGPARGPAGPASWDEAHDDLEMPSRRLTWRVVAFVVVLLAILGAAGVAIGWYARGAYYVGLDGGEVVIYQGRPGGLLWFSPTVEERTGLREARVPSARLDDVQSGHETSSLEDARRYVANLEELADATTPTTTVPTSSTVAPTTTAPG